MPCLLSRLILTFAPSASPSSLSHGSGTTASRMGRRPKEYSQAERLALMIRALASRTWTVNDLAQEFAVSRRQVYRDLAHIEEQGHPLAQSDGAGERTWQLPL